MAIDSSIHVWFNYVQDRCPSRQLWGQRWWPQSPRLPSSLSVSGLEWERAHAILTVLPFSSIAWDWQKHCLVIVDWQGVQICHNVGPLEKNRSANEMQIGRYKWAKEEKPLDLKLQKKKNHPDHHFRTHLQMQSIFSMLQLVNSHIGVTVCVQHKSTLWGAGGRLSSLLLGKQTHLCICLLVNTKYNAIFYRDITKVDNAKYNLILR